MTPEVAAILAEIRAMLGQLGAFAYNRRDAARMLGVSRRKLEGLITSGAIKTAAGDPHLIPTSEIRRYVAPRQAPARARGRRVASNTDEEIEAYRRVRRC
jgi:hypothetical protein